MPDIKNLTHAEIAAVLPPDETEDAAGDIALIRAFRIGHFDAELVRLGDTAALLDAWRGRIDRVPPRPAPRTLQELVAAARDRLRRDRLANDRLRIDRQVELITQVRKEIAR
jgi:hypothetical protein